MILFRYPFLLLHFICFKLAKIDDVVIADFEKYASIYRFSFSGKITYFNFCHYLIRCKEYRNVFYARISGVASKLHIHSLLNIFLPKYPTLFIPTPGHKIGKAFYVEHGYSTVIRARSIGDNCQVNQNVTIGGSLGSGVPKIGNNVKIFTGAVVVGNIEIGDNVIIGANATVVKDVPSNSTIVASKSRYILKDGVKCDETL